MNASAHSGRSHRTSSVLQDSDSVRRHSRLPELLTRKRTSSMPHRKDKDSTPGTSILPDALLGPSDSSTVYRHFLVLLYVPYFAGWQSLGTGYVYFLVACDVLIERLLLLPPVPASPARVSTLR